jgi:hypothetical protein
MRRSTSPVQYASLSADNRSFSTGSLMSNGRSHRPEGEQREPLVRCTAWFGGASSRRLRPPALCITGITVDPQILRQGKLVNLEVEVVRRSQRHPPQRGGFVVLHGALPSQDREVVQLPELGRPMEKRADVPYLERRDPQLFLELTPERGLGAFPKLDVATRKGDSARHHPLCGLPFLREDGRPLKDEGRDTLNGLSVVRHAAPFPYSLAA